MYPIELVADMEKASNTFVFCSMPSSLGYYTAMVKVVF